MRPRYQKGSVVQRGGLWVRRYYEDRVIEGGTKRVRVSRTVLNAKNKTDELKKGKACSLKPASMWLADNQGSR